MRRLATATKAFGSCDGAERAVGLNGLADAAGGGANVAPEIRLLGVFIQIQCEEYQTAE